MVVNRWATFFEAELEDNSWLDATKKFTNELRRLLLPVAELAGADIFRPSSQELFVGGATPLSYTKGVFEVSSMFAYTKVASSEVEAEQWICDLRPTLESNLFSKGITLKSFRTIRQGA